MVRQALITFNWCSTILSFNLKHQVQTEQRCSRAAYVSPYGQVIVLARNCWMQLYLQRWRRRVRETSQPGLRSALRVFSEWRMCWRAAADVRREGLSRVGLASLVMKWYCCSCWGWEEFPSNKVIICTKCTQGFLVDLLTIRYLDIIIFRHSILPKCNSGNCSLLAGDRNHSNDRKKIKQYDFLFFPYIYFYFEFPSSRSFYQRLLRLSVHSGCYAVISLMNCYGDRTDGKSWYKIFLI